MVDFKSLVSLLPEGRKREYLGQKFVNALIKYYEKYNLNEIDLDDLVVNSINTIINNKQFIKDLKLFAQTELDDIIDELGFEKNYSFKNVQKALIIYFNIEDPKQSTTKLEYNRNVDVDVPLHDFQERIRRKVINLIFNNHKRFLIHMPTGSGKTRTAAEIILDFIRFSASKSLFSNKIKILWIAQSSELCQQAAQTIEFIFKRKGTTNIRIEHFYDDSNISDDILNESAVIFCSIQKLILHYNEPIWKNIRNETYLVIVDEAHRSVASKWVQALNSFVNSPSVYLLGLTATPGISSITNENNHLLSTYYQNNKISITDENYTDIEYPIKYLVDKEILSEIERIDIDSFVELKESDYDFKDEEIVFKDITLEKLSLNPDRNQSIINIIKENHSINKKILIFTCGIEHNRILKSILKEYEIDSEYVDAKSGNRNSVIDRFKNGDLNVLLNFGVLTTGFDAPKTDVCIIARPINSIVMYSQMVGRILRGPKNKGNMSNKLYTIKDNLGHGDYDQLFKSFNEFYK